MPTTMGIDTWGIQLLIRYKPGKDNSNADVLSRLPLPESPSSVPLPGETVFLMDILLTSPVDARQIRTWTNNDPLLAHVKEMVLKGWSNTSEENLKPYQHCQNELSVHAVVYWQSYGNTISRPPESTH